MSPKQYKRLIKRLDFLQMQMDGLVATMAPLREFVLLAAQANLKDKTMKELRKEFIDIKTRVLNQLSEWALCEDEDDEKETGD